MSTAPKTDKETKLIEQLIEGHLSREDVFNTLIERLTTALKTVVEEAVQSRQISRLMN